MSLKSALCIGLFVVAITVIGSILGRTMVNQLNRAGTIYERADRLEKKLDYLEKILELESQEDRK